MAHFHELKHEVSELSLAADRRSIVVSSLSRQTEVAGVFDSYDLLCLAADALYQAGFAHWEVAREVPPGTAGAAASASEIADAPNALRTERVKVDALHETAGYMIGGLAVVPGIAAAWAAAAAEASIGATVAIVVFFGGGGALIGALLSAMMARVRKGRLVRRASTAGLVLWARARTPDLEKIGMETMRRYDARLVHAKPDVGR